MDSLPSLINHQHHQSQAVQWRLIDNVGSKQGEAFILQVPSGVYHMLKMMLCSLIRMFLIIFERDVMDWVFNYSCGTIRFHYRRVKNRSNHVINCCLIQQSWSLVFIHWMYWCISISKRTNKSFNKYRMHSFIKHGYYTPWWRFEPDVWAVSAFWVLASFDIVK